MEEKIYAVTAGSAQELQAKLSADLKKGKFDYNFIAISFTDPKIYVYPFHLPKAAHQQFLEQLKEEANQLLSLKNTEIELDYQIFNQKDEGEMVDGMFICMPRQILEQYISICDHAKLIPIHFTAHILTCIGTLYQKHKDESESFCILDFTKDNHVNLAVFCDNKCEFIRRIRNDDASEVRNDVLQSIRSASAKSEKKNIDHIYIGGEAKEHRQLIKEIVNDTNAKVVQDDCPQEQQETCDFRGSYFQVNLIKNYSFALPRRKQFFMISHIVLGILAFFLLIGFVRLLWTQAKIAKIKTSFRSEDLKYARELEKKVEEISNAK